MSLSLRVFYLLSCHSCAQATFTESCILLTHLRASIALNSIPKPLLCWIRRTLSPKSISGREGICISSANLRQKYCLVRFRWFELISRTRAHTHTHLFWPQQRLEQSNQAIKPFIIFYLSISLDFIIWVFAAVTVQGPKQKSSLLLLNPCDITEDIVQTDWRTTSTQLSHSTDNTLCTIY